MSLCQQRLHHVRDNVPRISSCSFAFSGPDKQLVRYVCVCVCECVSVWSACLCSKNYYRLTTEQNVFAEPAVACNSHCSYRRSFLASFINQSINQFICRHKKTFVISFLCRNHVALRRAKLEILLFRKQTECLSIKLR